jgi:hypothetical protein
MAVCPRYYVSGTVSLSGTNIFEAGTVIKMATNASIVLSSGFFTPRLVLKTTPWRPVICTAKDDDSVGDQISGSTGSPSGFYANPAFYFGGDGTSGRAAKFQRGE